MARVQYRGEAGAAGVRKRKHGTPPQREDDRSIGAMQHWITMISTVGPTFISLRSSKTPGIMRAKRARPARL